MARAVVIGLTGLIVGVVFGAAIWIVHDRDTGPAIVIEDPRPDATIVVAVNGAVASPGVQRLNGEARVQDALDAAGGVLEEADLSRINLAQRVFDGDEFNVPTKVAKPTNSPQSPVPVPRAAEVEADSAPSLVNVNTASAAELDTLPHIGPALAQRIIDYRTEHGPFRTVDDLANVDGISTKTVDDLRSLVTVGP